MQERYPHLGRLFLRVWDDPSFLADVVEESGDTLGEYLGKVESEPSLRAVLNTSEDLHLVVGFGQRYFSKSWISELHTFYEWYSDPRLASLNWIARDTKALTRLRSSPAEWLCHAGVRIPNDMRIHIHVNCEESLTVVLPLLPDGAVSCRLEERFLDGRVPPSIRYAPLLGIWDYDVFAFGSEG